jgi:outer membrane protein
MRKFVFFTLLVFLSGNRLSAQEKKVWTLDNCISFAMENNIALKRQELSTELDRKDLAQSKLNLLPNLNGQVEHNLGSGRVLDRGTYQWLNTDVSQGDLGVMSSVTLFGGLKGYHSIKKAEAGFLASRANLELMENNLVLQVMTGYLELLRREELYEIAVEKSRITGLQVVRMEKLLEVGNASPGELLEVKAQASNERYNQTLAKNAMDEARLELAQLLNLAESDSFEIEAPEIAGPSPLQLPDLETVYANAVDILPQIRGAEHNIAYYEKNLAVARGELSPEVYLRALYYSNYSDKLINPREVDPFSPVLEYPIPQQVLDNQYRQVSVGVNIPVFNRWQNRTNISKAKVSLQDAQYRLEDSKQQLFKEIQKYHSDARAAMDNFLATEESVENYEEAFRYTEERYKVGMATALELEEARNRLYTALAERISARYVFVFYMEILNFYQGKEISLQ